MERRIFRFDNAKFLLMFLVVFGHLLEGIAGRVSLNLYRTIYLFHMPAFVFLSGYFSSFQPKKIVFRLVLPYAVFQTLYRLFDVFVLKHSFRLSLFFTTPYWLMWYLFVMVIYHLAIPLFDTERLPVQILSVAVTIALSLLAGYVRRIGYFLSLSRLFTFAPYFLCGFYCKKDRPRWEKTGLHAAKWVAGIGAVISVIGIVFAWKTDLSVNILYGSYSYADGGYSPALKLFLLVIGLGGILTMALIPNKKIPIVTEIGANTFPIFCLHGFVVRLLGKTGIFAHSQAVNLIIAVILAAVIMAAFGNRLVSRLFAAVFSEKRWKKP